jgi:hypothetical protein
MTQIERLAAVGMRLHLSPQQDLVPDENDFAAEFGCRKEGTFDEWPRALVASHRINRDFPSHGTAFL